MSLFRTTRRAFLRHSTTCALATAIPRTLHAQTSTTKAERAVATAHAELWRRHIDEHGIVLDFTELDGSYERPTPEEARLGKPNAFAWWTPVENGAMFGGLYMDAAVNRTLHTKSEFDRAKARRLAGGLLHLASVGTVPGFVARGVAIDGQTTYAMGSSDQTSPWVYGLWRYVHSGLADATLRARIVAKMIEVADVLEQTDWRMPAVPPFTYRGAIGRPVWDHAPRLLFLLKALHTLTGDAKWQKRYLTALHEKPGDGGATRLELCEQGLRFKEKQRHSWTGSVPTVSLRGLWEMERDESLRAAYARGLAASVAVAAPGMAVRRQFKNESTSHFSNDWRGMNALWRPQQTDAETHALATEQLAWFNRQSPRRVEEMRFVREPLFAAWIVTLCPDRELVARHRDEIRDTLAHYRYDRLRHSHFFAAENTWWRLVDI
jgi:hypothetical protein